MLNYKTELSWDDCVTAFINHLPLYGRNWDTVQMNVEIDLYYPREKVSSIERGIQEKRSSLTSRLID